MARFGVPGQSTNTLSYTDNRLATVPAVYADRRPTITDKRYPLWCEWRLTNKAVAPVNEGEFWKLIKFNASGDAIWVMVDVGNGDPDLDNIRDQVDAKVTVSTDGNIDIDGVVVANAANPSGIPVETVADTANNTLDVQVQVAADITGAPGDTNDAGICSFDDTTFDVDVDGYVTLKGGPGPAIDTITGDDGEAVGADAAGNIDWQAETVANGTFVKPLYMDGTPASNLMNPKIQVGAAVTGAPGDVNDAGISSYSDAQFAVDSNGYVTVKGGTGPVLLTITGDDSEAVSPDGSGNIDWQAGVVANSANAKPLYLNGTPGSNLMEPEIQLATATATTNDENLAGIASFDSSDFSVNSSGFVRSLGGGGISETRLTEDFLRGITTSSSLLDYLFPVFFGGGFPSDSTSESGHPGILKTTASTMMYIALTDIDSSPNSGTVYLGSGEITYGSWAKVGNYTEAGNWIAFGFCYERPTSIPISQTKYAWITAVYGTTNFLAQNYDGTQTSTDTGVAVDGGWHLFEVIINEDATSIEFKIDGSVVATHTTNLPTADINCGILGYNVTTAVTNFVAVDIIDLLIKNTGDRA